MRVSLAEIKVRPGGKRLRLDHSLDVESLYIGRGPDNDLCLNGLTVSLHHATIRKSDGHLYIEAAPGQEITINGLPTQGERLSVGDEIHIGPWALRVLPPEPGEDLRIEYERRIADDDARAALDLRTRLGVERGFLAKRPISWIAIGMVLIGFLVLPLVWPSARPLWTTGPVIRGHAIIENDCGSCHSGAFHGVRNEACLTCHVDVRRHAPAELALPVLDELECADCHLEHRGREVSLADQGAAFCVDCHADLSSQLPETGLANARDFESDHPEIRLAIIAEPDQPPVREVWSEDLAEDPGIEFNHNLHVARPLDGPEDEEWLDCGQCHQPEDDGRRMQPVSYEDDCRRCHELDVGEPGLLGRLVHGDAERIREQIRAYYTDRVLAGDIRDPKAPGILRHRRPGPLVSDAERSASAAWVGGRVAAADAVLFDDDGCALCHTTRGGFISDRTGEWVPRSVSAVQIQHEWFPSARFDHSAHATWPCARCHPGAAVRDPDSDVEEEPAWARPGSIPYELIDDGPGIVISETASDVMIPGIATCRECHVGPDAGDRQKVSSPCSTCHDFHDNALAPMARKAEPDDDGETTDEESAKAS
ncbi:MAG TPA: FHA domain-containing protein [Deltaproteobacteria bacterium]|nr:FHA domain-containing protein [Deltaproteobacteria bacterium]